MAGGHGIPMPPSLGQLAPLPPRIASAALQHDNPTPPPPATTMIRVPFATSESTRIQGMLEPLHELAAHHGMCVRLRTSGSSRVLMLRDPILDMPAARAAESRRLDKPEEWSVCTGVGLIQVDCLRPTRICGIDSHIMILFYLNAFVEIPPVRGLKSASRSEHKCAYEHTIFRGRSATREAASISNACS
eukprot:1039914-Rhodomonas_salina.1